MVLIPQILLGGRQWPMRRLIRVLRRLAQKRFEVWWLSTAGNCCKKCPRDQPPETRITGWNLPGTKYQTGFQVNPGSWIKSHQRFNSAMIMPQGYAKWVINISLKNYFHWSCDHGIFCQVCESARINFESYRRAVKAACKCQTKECPAWACWCYDVEGGEDTHDICRCPGCDCDVCNSCKVNSLCF